MLPRRAVIFLALAWILVMLYPDPGMLLRSIRNTVRPQVQPQAVAAIARRLPNDPKAIEAYVLDKQVPYAYDWQSAGVPWYFPTTAEAVRARQGDCESRAVVLASILTAMGIPNSLRMSFNHIWVDYPGKRSNALENAGVQFAGSENGHFFIHWPRDFRLGQEISDQVAIFVTPAPVWRVLLLFAGLSLVVLWNALARLLGAGRLDGDGLLPTARPPRRRRFFGRRAPTQAPGARSGALAGAQRA
ncbi:MAG TPA: transglutaminase domain-containing protein [Thermoleophilia bacterium]